MRWIASDHCETPEGPPQLHGVRNVRVASASAASRASSARCVRPRARHPGARSVPRPAVHGDRVRPHHGGLAAPSAASSTRRPDPVIATMAEQVDIVAGRRSGRHDAAGLYPAVLAEDSIVAEVYGASVSRASPPPLRGEQRLPRPARGRPGLLRRLARPPLVEFVELPREVHPFYVATQAHPELRSRPTGRTRCSAASSPRRSSGTGRAAVRVDSLSAPA